MNRREPEWDEEVQGNFIVSELRRIFPIMKMTDDQLDDWNGFFPPGSPCVLKGVGEKKILHTSSAAWLVANRLGVVRLIGGAGIYYLHDLQMLETHKV